MSELAIAYILQGVLKALDYIHHMGYVHRYLKKEKKQCVFLLLDVLRNTTHRYRRADSSRNAEHITRFCSALL